jgi:hypothetical protein
MELGSTYSIKRRKILRLYGMDIMDGVDNRILKLHIDTIGNYSILNFAELISSGTLSPFGRDKGATLKAPFAGKQSPRPYGYPYTNGAAFQNRVCAKLHTLRLRLGRRPHAGYNPGGLDGINK